LTINEVSEEEEEEKPAEELIVPEEAIESKIYWSDYYNYSKFALGCFGIIFYLFVSLVCSFLLLAVTYWLAIWTSKPLEEQQKSYYPKIFVVIICSYTLSVYLRNFSISLLTLKSSHCMHNAMAERIIRSNIIFFDSNPTGRILTRFSKD